MHFEEECAQYAELLIVGVWSRDRLGRVTTKNSSMRGPLLAGDRVGRFTPPPRETFAVIVGQ